MAITRVACWSASDITSGGVTYKASFGHLNGFGLGVAGTPNKWDALASAIPDTALAGVRADASGTVSYQFTTSNVPTLTASAMYRFRISLHTDFKVAYDQIRVNSVLVGEVNSVVINQVRVVEFFAPTNGSSQINIDFTNLYCDLGNYGFATTIEFEPMAKPSNSNVAKQIFRVGTSITADTTNGGLATALDFAARSLGSNSFDYDVMLRHNTANTVEFYNIGHQSWTIPNIETLIADEVVPRIKSGLSSSDILIILEAGANDFGDSDAVIIANLTSLITAAQAVGQVAIMTILPRGATHKNVVNAWIIANTAGADFIIDQTSIAYLDDSAQFAWDTVHPVAHANEVIGKLLVNTIVPTFINKPAAFISFPVRFMRYHTNSLPIDVTGGTITNPSGTLPSGISIGSNEFVGTGNTLDSSASGVLRLTDGSNVTDIPYAAGEIEVVQKLKLNLNPQPWVINFEKYDYWDRLGGLNYTQHQAWNIAALSEAINKQVLDRFIYTQGGTGIIKVIVPYLDSGNTFKVTPIVGSFGTTFTLNVKVNTVSVGSISFVNGTDDNKAKETIISGLAPVSNELVIELDSASGFGNASAIYIECEPPPAPTPGFSFTGLTSGNLPAGDAVAIVDSSIGAFDYEYQITNADFTDEPIGTTAEPNPNSFIRSGSNTIKQIVENVSGDDNVSHSFTAIGNVLTFTEWEIVEGRIRVTHTPSGDLDEVTLTGTMKARSIGGTSEESNEDEATSV